MSERGQFKTKCYKGILEFIHYQLILLFFSPLHYHLGVPEKKNITWLYSPASFYSYVEQLIVHFKIRDTNCNMRRPIDVFSLEISK